MQTVLLFGPDVTWRVRSVIDSESPCGLVTVAILDLAVSEAGERPEASDTTRVPTVLWPTAPALSVAEPPPLSRVTEPDPLVAVLALGANVAATTRTRISERRPSERKDYPQIREGDARPLFLPT